jgi:hypothetical protein
MQFVKKLNNIKFCKRGTLMPTNKLERKKITGRNASTRDLSTIEVGLNTSDVVVEQFIRNNNSGGSSDFTTRFLQTGGNVDELRTLASLREDEWRDFDNAITRVARGKATLIADLYEYGMVVKLKNALAKMQHSWDRSGDLQEAQVDMTAEASTVLDRLEFGQDSIPIPIVSKAFRLDARHLFASRLNGEPLDVSQAEIASEKVMHKVETMALGEQFGAIGGAGRLTGLTSFPYRNAGILPTSWLSATGQVIFNDTNRMVEALEAQSQFGPYGMYIPRNYAPVLRRDYYTVGTTSNTGNSIYRRLMEIDSLKYIKTNVFLPNDHIVMINLSSQSIQLLEGFQPRMIEWSANGGMSYMFKVMAIMPIKIKRDALNQCGIAHFTL